MPKATRKSSEEYPARQVAPLHPGAVLGDIITDIGLSIRSVAGDLGVSHNALANLVAGRSDVTADMAVRIGRWTGAGARLWLDMQTSYDLWHAERRLAGVKITPAPREPKAA